MDPSLSVASVSLLSHLKNSYADDSGNGEVTELTAFMPEAPVDDLKIGSGEDHPTFNLSFNVLNPVFSAQELLATATARNMFGDPITLGDAVSTLGYDHLNWLQFLVDDTGLSACDALGPASLSPVCAPYTDISGDLPQFPTFDPPLGGWAYQTLDTGGF